MNDYNGNRPGCSASASAVRDAALGAVTVSSDHASAADGSVGRERALQQIVSCGWAVATGRWADLNDDDTEEVSTMPTQVNEAMSLFVRDPIRPRFKQTWVTINMNIRKFMAKIKANGAMFFVKLGAKYPKDMQCLDVDELDITFGMAAQGQQLVIGFL